MADPLTPRTFETLARRAGIVLVEHDGWTTRNRGNRGDGWGPVHGVMLHHTASKDLESTIRVVKDWGQSSSVPPPLYAGLIDKAGRLHMVGWGRCNHAGRGDDDVLRAVIREDATLPPANEVNTDGNARFYGFAGLNAGDGRDPWPPAQLQTLARVSAVICLHHKWTTRSVIGHRDWQKGKPDPHGPQGYVIPDIRKRAAVELGRLRKLK